MSEDTSTKNGQLKHLSFVVSTSSSAYAAAAPAVEKIYATAKTYVPASVAPEVAKLEESVYAAAVPLAAKATDAAASLLHYADDRVSGSGAESRIGSKFSVGFAFHLRTHPRLISW